MNNFNLGQKIIAINIALIGRLTYQFHDYIGPHNPNLRAGKPWLVELECVDPEHNRFVIKRWFDPDQMQIYNHSQHGTAVANSTAEATVESLNSGHLFQMCYFRGRSVEHRCLMKYWLNADHYINHLASVVDQAVVDGNPQLHSIESFFRRIRNMVLLFSHDKTPTIECLSPPRFSIPRSRFEAFNVEYDEKTSRQRWGQAFYGYMEAHKCQQDAWWWDRLYNADNIFARSMVRALLDHGS